ncbi:YciI family protein [Paracnuella aquatica]|uniref:YciI family protein n=1 Tax=Paracnuella aquatica TaxID=2268757 RepID=UPI000DEF2712|nr:YciI family protein [Paracnuella aquatica]RPD51500.1 hypothetical protein DRJ53_02135 [Paracnuella aquatica]
MTQQPLSAEAVMQKVATGKPYTLLHLLAAKAMPQDEAVANQLQVAHLAHLFTLEQQGNISVYGPVAHQKLRGIIIFNTNDHEAIAMLMATDPYIQGGYLRYELFNFFSIPGQTLAG